MPRKSVAGPGMTIVVLPWTLKNNTATQQQQQQNKTYIILNSDFATTNSNRLHSASFSDKPINTPI